MAACFLRPLLPPKPFLSARRPHLPAAPTISTTTVRCTAAPKPATSTPKPSQEEAVSRELQQVPQEPSGAATPDEANANPNSIPDEETPAAAAATTSFAVARRVPSAISPDRRRRTALTGGDHLLRGGAPRSCPWRSAAARTAPKMTAALAFLPEAEYPGLLAGARASCPHGGGVADAGHRYVF